MTAFLPDILHYNGKSYHLISVKNGTLYNPLDHGFSPVKEATYNPGGYTCTYEVANGILCLEELYINLPPETGLRKLFGLGPKKINGSKPQKQGEDLWNTLYTDIDLPMKYTGRILIGDPDGQSMMDGIPEAEDYDTAMELEFKDGKFVKEHHNF